MLAAGAGFTESEQRGAEGKNKDAQGQHGDHRAAGLGGRVGAPQTEAVLQGKGTGADASHKSYQRYIGVQIARGHTQHHAERAAQEYQGADHDDHAQHKADHRGGTRRRAVFLRGNGNSKGAQDQTNDFRTGILHRRCLMEAHGTRGITDKTGNTKSHVGRVPGKGQDGGDHAAKRTGQGQFSFGKCDVHTFLSLSSAWIILKCHKPMPYSIKT